MFVKYRNYRFKNAQVELVIDRAPLNDTAGNPWAYDERWKMRCWLDNPTASPIVMGQQLADLEAAFLVPNGDVRLLLDDGNTASHHVLLNRDTIGGLRITKPPSYPEGKGYQYGTFRIVDLEVGAVVPLPVTTRSPYSAFVETLSYRGGGPRFGHLEPLVGSPIKQLLKRNTIWRAVQQGTAVGIYGYPDPPEPIWPDALIEPYGPPIQYGPVERIGNSLVNYTISWTYEYEAANPRQGRPNVWSI